VRRYALMSFIVTIACITIVLALIVGPAQRQRAAVEVVLRHGGSVHYRNVAESASTDRERRFLRPFSTDIGSNVLFVRCIDPSLKDISLLSRLRLVVVLDLSDSGIRELWPLARRLAFETVFLYRTPVQDLTPVTHATRLHCILLFWLRTSS